MSKNMMQIIMNLKNNQNSITEQVEYNCDICKDQGYTYSEDKSTAKECGCLEVRRQKKIIEMSGLTKAFQKRTFGSYNTNRIVDDKTRSEAERIKNRCIEYVKNFKQNESKENNSLCLMGQVGFGKTHLATAILNNLMAKSIPVKFMDYPIEIRELKQSAMIQEDYNSKINKFRNARVLLIDDLFKNATYKKGNELLLNDVDLRIMNEIINYRYLSYKPTIFTSEYIVEQLIEWDSALGSRIKEMCDGNYYYCEYNELSNFRLYKKEEA